MNYKFQRIFRASCIFLLLFFPVQSYAHKSISNETISRLSSHKVWHKLLFYEKDESQRNGYLSAVHSPTFFLSKDGKSDSTAELLSTIDAFSQPAVTNTNQHAQCRFRGRFIWLKKEIPAINSLRTVNCPDYNDWSISNSVESVSIIFATGYLGNPASYYGHTLLKLNSDKSNSRTKLEDISVNFGAIIPRNEGIASYIVKGMFGGYDAGFSHIGYYYHDYNYGENELRDLWEYELDLTDFQLQLVLGHTWESLGKKYTYYFLDKNCVYRMAELLEVIDGVDIIPDNSLWIIPQALLQKMVKGKINNRSLIKRISYYPSRQSRLYSRYQSLSEMEKDTVAREIDEHATLTSTIYNSINLKSKQRVLDTLIDYYQYLRDPEELGADPKNTAYRKVLTERFTLPPGNHSLLTSTDNSPHLGRKPTLLQVGVTHNDRLKSGIRMRFRPAYYDALDSDGGHIANSMLSMAELEITALKGDIRINRFHIVKIESINANSTGLPGDRSFAWKLNLGMREAANDCIRQCLVTSLQGSMGYTFPIRAGFLLGGFFGGALQESFFGQGPVVATASIFSDFDSGYGFKTRISAEHSAYAFGSASSRNNIRLESHYQYNSDYGLRVYFEQSDAFEVGFSLSKYF